MILYYELKYHTKLTTLFYFKKMERSGMEKVPLKTPKIFVTNHQNAFLDAFMVGAWNKEPVYFLTRASVFKKPLVRWILAQYKMLPIYRIRDGKEAVKKNDEIFELCVDILEKNKGSILIFAEGNHGIEKNLRPLQKGVSRIAFEAEARNNFKLNVQVVPIGLNYDTLWAFRTNFFMNVGDPIAVNKFAETYEQDENQAMLDLKDELAQQLKPLIININPENYDETEATWKSIRKKQPTLKEQFEYDQALINNIESGKELPPPSKKRNKKFWLNPLSWYVILNHALPILLLNKILKPVKDRAFYASIKFVIGMFTIPLVYALQTWLVYKLTDSPYISLGYLISLPVLGIAIYDYYKSDPV